MVIDYDQVLVRFCEVDVLNAVEAGYIARFKPKFNITIPSRRPLPKVVVDLDSLTTKLGFNWKRTLPESSRDLKRRRVA